MTPVLVSDLLYVCVHLHTHIHAHTHMHSLSFILFLLSKAYIFLTNALIYAARIQ